MVQVQKAKLGQHVTPTQKQGTGAWRPQVSIQRACQNQYRDLHCPGETQGV